MAVFIVLKNIRGYFFKSSTRSKGVSPQLEKHSKIS